VLEGDVDPAELVAVLRFTDAGRARAYVNSPQYLAGKAHRINGGGVVESRLIA